MDVFPRTLIQECCPRQDFVVQGGNPSNPDVIRSLYGKDVAPLPGGIRLLFSEGLAGFVSDGTNQE